MIMSTYLVVFKWICGFFISEKDNCGYFSFFNHLSFCDNVSTYFYVVFPMFNIHVNGQFIFSFLHSLYFIFYLYSFCPLNFKLSQSLLYLEFHVFTGDLLITSFLYNLSSLTPLSASTFNRLKNVLFHMAKCWIAVDFPSARPKPSAEGINPLLRRIHQMMVRVNSFNFWIYVFVDDNIKLCRLIHKTLITEPHVIRKCGICLLLTLFKCK